MLQYKVILGWRCSFIFDEPDVAMNFAINAIKHRNLGDNDEVEVKIELIVPENVEEAEHNVEEAEQND